MQGENQTRVPFDDRAALQELERLQRSIQEYRKRRETAEGEFEQFVGSFRTPSGASEEAPSPPAVLPGFHVAGEGAQSVAGETVVAAPRAQATAPAISTSQPAAGAHEPATVVRAEAGGSALPKPIGAPVPPPTLAAAASSVPPPATSAPTPPLRVGQAFDSAAPLPKTAPPAVALPDDFFSGAGRTPESAEAAAGGSSNRKYLPFLLVGLAIAVIAAVLLMRSPAAPVVPSAAPAETQAPSAAAQVEQQPPSAAAPAEQQPVAQSPVGTPSAATAAPAAAAPSVAAPAPPAEIRTVRRVWVRVTVDGQRAVERELEADARVPLPAGRTFVVRAGDAGALHFLLNGKDQGPLGADAQVVTRTFSVPGP
jgi:hypothetical protein